MCATRSSWCTLASTNVRRTSGNTWGGATNICGWRPRPKAKRKCHPIVELLDAVQWEDVQKFLPEGCRMGSICWTGLGVFPPGATGQQELGARLYGVKGFAHVTDPKLSPKEIGSVTSLFLPFSFSHSLSFSLSFSFFLFGLVGFGWVFVAVRLCGCVCVFKNWCVVWCNVACCGVVARCGAQSRSREKNT